MSVNLNIRQIIHEIVDLPDYDPKSIQIPTGTRALNISIRGNNKCVRMSFTTDQTDDNGKYRTLKPYPAFELTQGDMALPAGDYIFFRLDNVYDPPETIELIFFVA